MNVLIVEDEPLAAERLEKLVYEIVPGVHVLAKLDSVRKTVQWLTDNTAPGLILMDIQLADGLSFQIFEQCAVTSPVIFTTAYDAYALKAFKVNSVDYILKPVDKGELAQALKKLGTLTKKHPEPDALLQNITHVVNMLAKKYKERFVIKVGEHLKTVDVKNVLYFTSQEKTTFAHTVDNRSHILDFTLEQVESMVNPDEYFRVNRKYLVRGDAIQDIIAYTNSRLKLMLKQSQEGDVIVARERVQEFRQWLDR